MICPEDMARLFRDVIAAGTRHQTTLDGQAGREGFLFKCRQAAQLPLGVASPYLEKKDTPGPFLAIDPAGKKPERPEPDAHGVVSDGAHQQYEQRSEAWNAHRKLYDDLFAARTPPEQLELVVAVGLIEYADPENGDHYQRHLVVAPAEIELDQRSQRLTVSATDTFRPESSWLSGRLRLPLAEAQDDRSSRPLLEVLADDAETFDAAADTWHLARSVFGQDTQWESDEFPDSGSVALSVEPVVLLRKKDTSHLLSLLTHMVDDIEAGGHVSGPMRMLVDMSADVEDLPLRNDSPALPLPANDEQRSLLEQARRSPHSIIQGPPGTGKTHTIANLAAVLMAEGRRVLITAENDRALHEVQGKLPERMQPLLLPLLKDKADSGLARSVSTLIEEADKERRNARGDEEKTLSAERDRLAEEARRTVAAIRRIDGLEEKEHELNGSRMRLSGHMLALDNNRDALALADRYLTDQVADANDGTSLLELQPVVTQADRDLVTLRLPTNLPDPAEFAQRLQETREQLGRLPERTAFDYAALHHETVSRVEAVLPRMATLAPVPYASLDLPGAVYRGFAKEVRRARSGLNHGVTATGGEPNLARTFLSAYLDLPGYYRGEPDGLVELHRRGAASTGKAAVVQIAASADPVTIHERAHGLDARFRNDPSNGLLDRYATDLRRRGESSLRHLANYASELAAQLGMPPTLPISVSAEAPALHDLLEQARMLNDHLAAGGRMTRIVGTPSAVKRAQPLLEHVTVGGSRVNTAEKAAAAAAWFEHHTTVQTARNWAEQNDLDPPASDRDLKDWLTALARLPEDAANAEKELTALVHSCHVPSDAQTLTADELTRDVVVATGSRIAEELSQFAQAREQLGALDIRLDGVAVHDEVTARKAYVHLDSLITRSEIAGELPGEWTGNRELHSSHSDDPLAIACEVAAAVAEIPGAGRPQTLSDEQIRTVVLAGVHADRKRDEVLSSHSTFLNGIRAALSLCTPPSPATDLLADAAQREDAAAYRRAYEAHVEESQRAKCAVQLRDATSRLKRAHPRLISSFLSEDGSTHDVLTRLHYYQGLLHYRRAAQELLAEYPDVRELHERLGTVRTAELNAERKLASARCWGRAVERLADSRELAATLSSLQKAEQDVPKTKTAKTYQRKLRAMREATKAAAPAIPCWVMPIDKVAELIGYPSNIKDRFDVVIVDEASQAWFPSAFLYAIAEQVIVVGDHLQTSPSDTSVGEDEMRRLLDQHIQGHKLANQLDREFSLYDVASGISSPSVMADHFRCVPPVIELSNRLCYAQSGQRLLPVRVTEPEALTPIQHVRVDGQRTSDGGANGPEVDAIVHKVVACHASQLYDDLSFGVVVVGPKRHAHVKRLRSQLLEALGPQAMAERQIEVGSPAQYQGAERNVMFLSLIEAPDASGRVRNWPHELTGRNLRRIQELNVAVSRAQDQLWVFHSFGPENLQPDDARHVLLTPAAVDDDTTLDAQLAKCESDFEKDVVKALDAHPKVAKVRTQVEALGFHIDLVIQSYDKRRLAVECDGDLHHTSDSDVARDLYRQRTLEVAGGWRFQRFLASEWYADSGTLVEQTVNMLGGAPIPSPHPPIEDANGDHIMSEEPTPEPVDLPAPPPLPVLSTVDIDGAAHGPSSGGERNSAANQAQSTVLVSKRSEIIAPAGGARDLHEQPKDTQVRSTAHVVELLPYTAFSGDLVPVKQASLEGLIVGLESIVEIEGPATGFRLRDAYLGFGSLRRRGDAARNLKEALMRAVEEGRLVSTNLLEEEGVLPQTFWLPSQGVSFEVRQLGPRAVHEVPPEELAMLMEQFKVQDGRSQHRAAVYHTTIEALGLSNLSSKIEDRLSAVADWMKLPR